MDQLTIYPIGVVHSPYTACKDIPIQGIFNSEVEAWVELREEYVEGLRDLDEFSHAILIYYFHLSQKEQTQGKPFLEEEKHGIFAIRSPHRPNHIGLSIVRTKRIERNRLYFTEVDVLDGTPLLDIKPYVKYFDQRENVVSGWLDNHFENGRVPNKIIIE